MMWLILLVLFSSGELSKTSQNFATSFTFTAWATICSSVAVGPKSSAAMEATTLKPDVGMATFGGALVDWKLVSVWTHVTFACGFAFWAKCLGAELFSDSFLFSFLKVWFHCFGWGVDVASVAILGRLDHHQRRQQQQQQQQQQPQQQQQHQQQQQQQQQQQPQQQQQHQQQQQQQQPQQQQQQQQQKKGTWWLAGLEEQRIKRPKAWGPKHQRIRGTTGPGPEGPKGLQDQTTKKMKEGKYERESLKVF